MKKSKWLDCQGNEFFPKQKGTPSLVKIEHKNTATLDSARSKKKYKVAVLQLAQGHNTVTMVRLEPAAFGLEQSTLPLSRCTPLHVALTVICKSQ